ncbi:hypothetical protein BX661DRAFT_90341 [Kickxella alabastrina]|uniref:uncharacterized protein n=1 Tax=Kickxella alabastrina TaxID=61397 RepID=UPI002220A769|nr:uncharacterized protein BX661DRAFT_90341 [Kickxella alabastrina]KAI7830894.1 hypothetical protein BX661DRAFT_90341 [Kickxella alabastrina]
MDSCSGFSDSNTATKIWKQRMDSHNCFQGSNPDTDIGNKEWTPASATAPTPVPAQSTRTAANAFANRLGSFSKPSNSRNNSVFGSTNAFAKVNASSATNPAFKSTSAFGATKTQPPPANFSSSQTTSVNFAPSNCTNQSMPLPAFQKTTAVTRPLAVPRATAGTFMRAPVAAKRGVPEGRRLPTMYDILGIEPPKPKERDYGVRRRTVIPEPAVSAVASEPWHLRWCRRRSLYQLLWLHRHRHLRHCNLSHRYKSNRPQFQCRYQHRTLYQTQFLFL